VQPSDLEHMKHRDDTMSRPWTVANDKGSALGTSLFANLSQRPPQMDACWSRAAQSPAWLGRHTGTWASDLLPRCDALTRTLTLTRTHTGTWACSNV
jgi:hypothetical protein